MRSSLGQLKRIRPGVTSVRQKDSRAVQVDLVWEADEPMPNGFRPFVHFVDQENEIVFQASCDPLPWSDGDKGRFALKANAQLPGDRESGETFELRVGMYHPTAGGRRLLLMGDDDGEQRIRLGTLRLTGEHDADAGIHWTPQKTTHGPYLDRNNLDAKPIDFGWIVTAGGCRLTRRDGDLLLTPLPEEFADIQWDVRWDRLPWNLPRPTRVEALSESGDVLWEQPLGESLVIKHDPEVFTYRLAKGQ